MINIIKNRIKICENQILNVKVKIYETFGDEKILFKGMLIGLEGELKTLNELLISAQTLEELERSA